MAKVTTEQFIENAKKVHGDKYDYSKVIYEHSKKDVIIICPIHGEFLMRPNNHLNGQGCPSCGGTKKLTTEIFIQRSKAKHGDKYDYSKTKYVNKQTHVIITCPKHGDFKMLLGHHMNGSGCKECHFEKLSELFKMEQEEFVERANKIHNNKYTYGKYKSYEEDVEIICPIHGKFGQTPHNHLSGNGCPKCKSSHLEREVINMLDKEKIVYIYACNKVDLCWLNKMHLDFFLPQYKIAIECQGAQHYVPSNFGSKKKKPEDCLRETKQRDERKRKLCEEHNVRLLYFSDKQYEENIIIDKNKLMKEIKKYDL